MRSLQRKRKGLKNQRCRTIRIRDSMSLSSINTALLLFKMEFKCNPLNLCVPPVLEFFALEITQRIPIIDSRYFFKARWNVIVNEGLGEREWALERDGNCVRSNPD